MRCKPTTFRCALGAALAALALAAVLAPPVAPVLADEAGGEETEPPMRGRLPPDEPEAGPEFPTKRLGDTRRPDPFDAIDEAPATGVKQGSTAERSDTGAVICEAGCDGPSGMVVYRRDQPAG
jgi:hypothetical protein